MVFIPEADEVLRVIRRALELCHHPPFEQEREYKVGIPETEITLEAIRQFKDMLQSFHYKFV